MFNHQDILEKLRSEFGESIRDVKISKARRIYFEVDASIVREVLSFMKNNLGFDHLSTITGLDTGTGIELIYHVVYENSLVASLKTKILKTDPRIKSISDIYPTAELYEREVHDILGVKFEGHPNLSRLLLPEDWPENLHPLRKDVTLEQISSRIDKEWGRE